MLGMSKKIIAFVDWDGVLNNFDLALSISDKFINALDQQEENPPLSPVAFGLLNRLCMDHPELYIVCSSTWRADGKEAILDSLKNAHKRLVSAVGIEEIPFAIRFHDEQLESWRTRLGLMYDEPRGRAIDQWLEDFSSPDQDYFIVDDDSDFYEHQKPFFFETDGLVGFNQKTFFDIDEFIGNRHKNRVQPQKQLLLNFG
jgi:hypothetical protein